MARGNPGPRITAVGNPGPILALLYRKIVKTPSGFYFIISNYKDTVVADLADHSILVTDVIIYILSPFIRSLYLFSLPQEILMQTPVLYCAGTCCIIRSTVLYVRLFPYLIADQQVTTVLYSTVLYSKHQRPRRILTLLLYGVDFAEKD